MRIHGQTDKGKLRCVPLKVVTQKVLQVTAARRKGRLQHNLSYRCPCRSKVQRAVQKKNRTTVHILTLHSVLISPSNFCTQQTPKISEHETSYSSSKSTNFHYNTVICYRPIFCCIILSQSNGCEEILEA
jgi:hypothetical protein